MPVKRSDSSIALLTAAMPRPAALYNRRKWQLIGMVLLSLSTSKGWKAESTWLADYIPTNVVTTTPRRQPFFLSGFMELRALQVVVQLESYKECCLPFKYYSWILSLYRMWLLSMNLSAFVLMMYHNFSKNAQWQGPPKYAVVFKCDGFTSLLTF